MKNSGRYKPNTFTQLCVLLFFIVTNNLSFGSSLSNDRNLSQPPTDNLTFNTSHITPSTIFDIRILHENNKQDLRPYFSYLIANNDTTISDAINSKYWQHSNQAKFNNYVKNIWLKTTLSNPSSIPVRLLLEQGNPRIDLFEVFIYSNNQQLIESYKLGKSLPFKDRLIEHRRFLIPITINPGETLIVVFSGNAGSLDLLNSTALWDADYYFSHDKIEDLLGMFYLGAIFSLAFYNLFIFIITREKNYFYYSLFACSTFAFFLILEGWAYQYIWPENTAFNLKATSLCIGALIFSSALFSSQFLDLKKEIPYLDLVLKIGAGITVILSIISFVLPHDPIYRLLRLSITIAIPIYLTSWVAGIIISIKKQRRDAYIFTGAWSMLIIATLITIIHESVTPLFTFSTLLFLQASHLIEMILLSMALATYITRLKLQESLSKAKSDAQSKFLARMSHEIRTPMNGILGMSDLLIKEENLNSKRNMIGVIHSSAVSLEKIINDILDHSKLEAGKLLLQKDIIQIRSYVREISDVFMLDSLKKNINLSIEVTSNVPQEIIADKLRLRQVLLNIISNAFKFTEQGSILISISYHENPDKSIDNQLKFIISDTGRGIAKDDQNRLFEAFEQASNNNLRGESSTGLGLSISKDLIELMGGNIQVSSTLNVGSHFNFTIALKTNTEDISINPEVFPTFKKGQFNQINVLVAEDNLTNQIVVKTMLEKLGIPSTITNNGLEAIEQLDLNSYDLILMDCEMPLMNGFEATRAIREKEKTLGLDRIIIIALTAHTLHDELQACYDSGMDDLLLKPITLDKLNTALHKQLDAD